MPNSPYVATSISGLLLSLCLFLNSSAQAYVGSEQCVGCHELQYQEWLDSHHFAAMAEASDASVLGDFDDSRFSYNGITSRFYKLDGRFFVTTDNADGQLQEFEITYTFGVYPLQQYLVDFPDGRKQVLGIVWDSRPREAGGQRWYHLYPEHPSLDHGAPIQPVDSNDPLHWTGIYFNWNSRCASCHSTNLQRDYDPATNRYATTWSEISVGCEACHGPAEDHLTWVRKGVSGKSPHHGFTFSLADQGIWQAVADLANGGAAYPTLKRSGPSADTQKKQCASCHSRRTEIAQPDPRIDYYDSHQLSLLESPLYHADGQIRDEVYVWGSFLQSKMHGEGVTCSNCHNPHSLKLKAEDNGVCTQCHNADVFDTPRHHHHDPDSVGSLCADCHMPTTTYMGVDARRDHSLRIPRPAQSAAVGAPNACNQCHQDRDADWAQHQIDGWLKGAGKTLDRPPFADAFHAADSGQAEAGAQLLQIANDTSLPAIVRGSAILRHAPYHDRDSLPALQRLLDDEDILVRQGALRSMDSLPLAIRYRLLAPHFDETVIALRVEIARLLAGIRLDQLDSETADQLSALFRDFLQSSAYNADMPESLIVLGHFHTDRLEFEKAEKAYKQALTVSPKHEGVLLNLADLYRQTGRDAEAGTLLEQAVAVAPQSPASHYALGLFHIRQQQYEQATAALKTATDLVPADPRYAYTYALALGRLGRIPQAVAHLQEWLRQHGPNPEAQQVLRKLQRKVE